MANIDYYVDNIKFQLTGYILESELPDESYARCVKLALDELNRYYDGTRLVEVPGSQCIDLKQIEDDNNICISSISAIYRCRPNGTSNTDGANDPMLISQWNLANNFYNYGSQRWLYNYLAYNTTNQITNTLSTDLDFKEDHDNKKLYINYNGSKGNIVIEYVPVLKSVEELSGEYWTDILRRLSLAHAKIELGRIRTRYTQSNSLWKQDGETLLAEGNTEINALFERLAAHANFSYPLD